MLDASTEAQLLYDETHIHLIAPHSTMEPHEFILDNCIVVQYCFLSMCGEWLPTFHFAFGEPNCACCLAADYLYKISKTE